MKLDATEQWILDKRDERLKGTPPCTQCGHIPRSEKVGYPLNWHYINAWPKEVWDEYIEAGIPLNKALMMELSYQ